MKKILTISLMVLLFASTAEAFTFYRNLNAGSQGEDVRQLQIFLNNYSNQTQIASSGAGSPSNETTYFGTLTKEALIDFQNINFAQILAPAGLTTGTGYFGPSTRNFINTINQNPTQISSNETDSTLSNKPVIFSISPNKGEDGTEITVRGSGFTDDNVIISAYENRDKYINYKSNKLGTEIIFKINSRLQEKFKEQTQKMSSKEIRNVLDQIVDVPIAISIKNENGESNYKIFNFKYK